LPVDIQNFDLFFSNAIRSIKNLPLDIATHILTAVTYGGVLWVGFALFLWKRGYRLLAIQIGLAMILGLAETSILKHIFHRARPVSVDLFQFWMPMHQLFADQYSFPSGHTSLSFAAAGIIFYKFPDWRGWSALGLALVVGLCRIYEGMHWPTDVLTGILIGLSASALAVPLSRRVFPSVKDDQSVKA
jgi:undecaprenyl-diphosphatase